MKARIIRGRSTPKTKTTKHPDTCLRCVYMTAPYREFQNGPPDHDRIWCRLWEKPTFGVGCKDYQDQQQSISYRWSCEHWIPRPTNPQG